MAKNKSKMEKKTNKINGKFSRILVDTGTVIFKNAAHCETPVEKIRFKMLVSTSLGSWALGLLQIRPARD